MSGVGWCTCRCTCRGSASDYVISLVPENEMQVADHLSEEMVFHGPMRISISKIGFAEWGCHVSS